MPVPTRILEYIVGGFVLLAAAARLASLSLSTLVSMYRKIGLGKCSGAKWVIEWVFFFVHALIGLRAFYEIVKPGTARVHN